MSYNLGLLLQSVGEQEKAAECYQLASETQPDFPAALTNLGHALKASGKDEEARAAWSKAVEVDPELAAGISIDASQFRLSTLDLSCSVPARKLGTANRRGSSIAGKEYCREISFLKVGSIPSEITTVWFTRFLSRIRSSARGTHPPIF